MLNIMRFIIEHPLGKQRPFFSVKNFLMWQVKSRVFKRFHNIEWIENSILVASNGMTGATGNIYVGLHEFCDMEFALHFLREEDTFLDIGANIGSYTVLSSKVVGSKTIAFEPDPDTAQSLFRNISVNDIKDRVVVHQTALGEKNGMIEFTVGLDTTNHVACGGEANTRAVPIQRLEDIDGAGKAIFAKLDTEGHEREVLRGARGIATELDDEEVEKELFGYGFKKYFYDPFSRELKEEPIQGLTQSNSIYARDFAKVMERLKGAPRRRWSNLTI